MSRSFAPAVLFVALSTAALPLVHGLGTLARLALPGPPAALALSAGCLAVCAVAAWFARGERPAPGTLATGISGVVSGAALGLGFGAAGAGLALAAVAPLLGRVAHFAARRLPDGLSKRAARRPWLTTAWMVLGLACVAQTARISSFMSDDSLAHGPTIEGFWEHHMCLPAYLHAAELNRDGDANVYHAGHYPGVTRDAEPSTQVAGMQHYLEDPYQYPPQFLLLGHALVSSGLDFASVRSLWFAAQALLFFATLIALARFVGGERGWQVLTWAPLVWLAPVTMFNFQYGQAHLAVLCIAVLAMLAFARRRDVAGGTLLACAVLAKLFPALLLIPLVVQRRWKALGMTAAAACLITAVSIPVLGTAPYQAFFEYHLPRLASGDAFSFQEAWPEAATELIASNQSIKGLVDKLVLLGWPAAAGAKSVLGALYSLSILVLAVLASRRASSRHAQAVLWLGLLTLGALSSPGAWADYVLVSAVWLLAFASAPLPSARVARAALAGAWFLFVLQPGVFPLIPVGGERGMLIASLVGYAAVLVFSARQLMWLGSASPALAKEPAALPIGRRVESVT